MALNREQKKSVVKEAQELLTNSKLSVAVNYQGTSVQDLQTIRKLAKSNGSTVKVIKNRLFIQALKGLKTYQAADVSQLNQMLLYVFNDQDESLAAKTIAEANKTIKTISYVGAYQSDGQFIDAQSVKMIASLPSKDQLRAQLVGTLQAPLSGFVSVLNNNLAGLLNVLKARQETIK